MRPLSVMALGALFLFVADGQVFGQRPDKCAAEKTAVTEAKAAYKAAQQEYLAAIEAMADAYGEVSKATGVANAANAAYIAASRKSAALDEALSDCLDAAPKRGCQAERDAAVKAGADLDAAETASRNADLALGAAQTVLDDAKARFRAAAAAEEAAQEALDQARIALGKCMRRKADSPRVSDDGGGAADLGAAAALRPARACAGT